MIPYFAYGSNMNKEDLNKWCLKKGYSKINIMNPKVARLDKYKLDFNYYSSTRQGGAANLMDSSKDAIWGLLIDLNEEDYKKISEKEGSPNYYHEIPVTVNVEGIKIGAKSFKVIKNKEQTTFQPPTKEYLQLIIDSAVKYNFPEEYINKLRKIKIK